jgi:GTP-binding protein Era
MTRIAVSCAAAPPARRGLGKLLERPVHLFLNVEERAGWGEEGVRLRAIGRDDPD